MRFEPKWLASVRISKKTSATAAVMIHPVVLRDRLTNRRYAALGEFAGLIIEGKVLENPTGVFKGINRPLHSAGVDNFVFIYAAKPTCTYRFSGDTRSADVLLAPKNSVFVTYLSLNRSMLNDVQAAIQSPPNAFRGVILGWEWVPEAPTSPGLPNNHDKRYKGRVWQ